MSLCRPIKLKLALALGLGGIGLSGPVSAAVSYYDWTGRFTFLDSDGRAFANSSIPAKGNKMLHHMTLLPTRVAILVDRQCKRGLSKVIASTLM